MSFPHHFHEQSKHSQFYHFLPLVNMRKHIQGFHKACIFTNLYYFWNKQKQTRAPEMLLVFILEVERPPISWPQNLVFFFNWEGPSCDPPALQIRMHALTLRSFTGTSHLCSSSSHGTHTLLPESLTAVSKFLLLP